MSLEGAFGPNVDEEERDAFNRCLDPLTDPGDIADLVEKFGYWAQRAAATNPSTPSEILVRFMDDGTEMGFGLLASANPSTPMCEIERMTHEGEDRAAAVAMAAVSVAMARLGVGEENLAATRAILRYSDWDTFVASDAEVSLALIANGNL